MNPPVRLSCPAPPSAWDACRVALLLLVVIASPACFLRSDVTRVVDGQAMSGRYIRPDAYALFMQGIIAEESGHLAHAERYYLAAYRRDPDGVAILARLGAVRCAWGPQGYAPAERAFEEALELDATYAPTHLERARCELHRSAFSDAVRSARRALALAPQDIQTSLLLVEALQAKGEDETAARVLDGLAYVARSERVWRKVESFARRRGDATRRLLASRHLERGGAKPADLDAIDAALIRGDLAEAQALAAEAGMELGHLAVRAAALGMWRVAREQAGSVLAAEPGHSDALVAWLASPGPQVASASVDPAIWRRLMRTGQATSRRPLSALGALVLADALRRRFGERTASAWLEARQPPSLPAGEHSPSSPAASDALARALRARLQAHPSPVQGDDGS